jgi:hypothetical protein
MTRDNWEAIFRFASTVYQNITLSKRTSIAKRALRDESERIMDICEDVIGQQYRPGREFRVSPGTLLDPGFQPWLLGKGKPD